MLRCRLPELDLLYRERNLPVAPEAVYQLEANPAFQRLILCLQYKADKLAREPFNNDDTKDVQSAVNVAKGAALMLKEMDAQMSVMRKSEDGKT